MDAHRCASTCARTFIRLPVPGRRPDSTCGDLSRHKTAVVQMRCKLPESVYWDLLFFGTVIGLRWQNLGDYKCGCRSRAVCDLDNEVYEICILFAYRVNPVERIHITALSVVLRSRSVNVTQMHAHTHTNTRGHSIAVFIHKTSSTCLCL